MIARPEFYTLVGVAALVIVVVTGARRWREVRHANRELARRRTTHG